jgi:hypothetical protein
VNPKEQEIAIKELEERVDRLRNIYEQYFLGFEKLEPTVPRKDVDRRFALLRKEQIRNTAVRFRFNVVTQKYNTYSTHWIRICRQIEEGTYKRHVRRAKARFGDTASAPERDISIDIDMGDFDDMDDMDSVLDEVLAEANAAAESYERDAPDTVPPPRSAPQGAPRTAAPRQMVIATPGPSSFALDGAMRSREAFDGGEPNTPAPATAPDPTTRAPAPDRAARPAALPAGAKPRVMLRKRDETELAPTSRTLPGVAPATTPRGGAPPVASPPVASPPVTRPMASPPVASPPMARPMASPAREGAPAVAYANPLGPAPRKAPVEPGAGQVGAGQGGTFATGAGSPRPGTPRIAPVAPASSASAGASGASANAGASPAGRSPLGAPSGALRPAHAGGRLPAAAPLPAPSAGRLPVAAPLPAPSAGRLSVSAPLPAPSAGRLPVARPPGAQPQRPPMPSITEKDEQDTIPPPPPSNPGRTRAPLPLPSQIVRPKPPKG